MKGKLVPHPGLTRMRLMKKLALIIFSLCLAVAVYLYIGQTLLYKEAQARLNELELNLKLIKTQNESLKEEMALLQDEEYIEIRAREQLGMAKEGEIIFYVAD